MNPTNKRILSTREVVEVTDSDRIYASRVVAAGPLIFFGGTAYDQSGQLATEAIASPPYHLSPAAQVTQQGSYLFNKTAEGLESVGSGLENIVQVEQFIPGKAYADGHVTNRSQYLATARPTTMMGATGPMVPDGAVISMLGIAARPDAGFAKELAPLQAGAEGGGFNWSQLGEAYADGPPYTDVVLAGPYVFVTGEVTVDATTGQVAPQARVADWIWAGSEARNEAGVLLKSLNEKLERVGGDLAQVIHVTLFVTDIADVFEIDRVWRRLFGDAPPARTIIPVRGVGSPRREGTGMGHSDGAVKLEQQVRALQPGHGLEVEAVTTSTGRLAHEAEAIRAGSLVWISHQYPQRTAASGSVKEQVNEIFDRLAEVCEAAGTTLSRLAQLRVFTLETSTGDAVSARLRELVPTDPPVVAIMSVPGPLLVPAAALFVDAVVQVGESE